MTSPHAPIRGLVFDMDGTIIDTRPFHMQGWRQLAANHGLSPDHYQKAEDGFGKTNWLIFEEWWGTDSDRSQWDAISQEKETYFRAAIEGHCTARPGFLELLDFARRRGLKVALATSGPRENAEFLLGELAVADRFDAVIYGHAGIKSKPHPEPFLLAAEAIGIEPLHCLGFEDSTHGFKSVRDAGMGLVAIAERPADLLPNREWTPWSYADFLPVPGLIDELR